MRSSRPRTVVHVVGQLDVGGMEKLLVEFARHSDRDRFQLHVVNLSSRGVIADELDDLGCPVTSLEAGRGLRPWLIVRLAKIFRKLRADIVHTHNSRALIYGGPAGRLAGARVVLQTRHGQEVGITPRLARAVRWASRSVDWVVCVSKDSAAAAEEQGVPRARIISLLNGIDLSRFGPADSQSSGPILAIGRLSPEKDFATLLRAMAIAAKEDPSIHLEIAGDGSCAVPLRKLASELYLNGTVRFLGRVMDIPALLKRGSIFTLSSLTEGVSLTILEAMASSLPAVATRVGGNPEVIEDGKTGFLVPAGDPLALATALLRLWRDPGLRLAMGRAGRARAEACFDIRQMVAAYERLYLSEDESPQGTAQLVACSSTSTP